METTILIAGNPSKLNTDLAHEALSQKRKVLLTNDPGTELAPIPVGLEDGLKYVEWNRRSPISARFVMLQAANQDLDIDHAIIIHTPRNLKTPVHDLSSGDIEERLDYDCKGYIFLLKELVQHFSARRKGSITFLSHNTGPDILSPMEAILDGAFEKLAESMFLQYEQDEFTIRGISTKLNQNRQIAEFVLQTIDENNARSRGKWHKFTGKSGIFGIGR